VNSTKTNFITGCSGVPRMLSTTKATDSDRQGEQQQHNAINDHWGPVIFCLIAAD